MLNLRLLILFALISFGSCTNKLTLHSNIYISDWGKQFQPANPVELISSIPAKSLLDCARLCNLNILCQTFDYDTSTLTCRLMESTVRTGSIISSASTSRVGTFVCPSQPYLSYNQICSQCEQNRYLVCLNGTCQCPPHSFWNGTQCDTQRYLGQTCNQTDSCRGDLFGLQCTVYKICLNNTNPPPIIQWSFKGNLNDTFGVYNGISMNGTIQFIASNYSNYNMSAYFTNQTYVLISYPLKLINTSFTLSAWFMFRTNNQVNTTEFGLFTYCGNQTINKCFNISVRYGRLFASFSMSTLIGNSSLTSNLWYHVAFIYDRAALTQSFYLNGKLDGILFASEVVESNTSEIRIGASPNTINSSIYLNQMIFVSYVKNSSEILDEATLAAYYTFDNSFIDSSSNNIQYTTQVSTQFDLNGRVNQALLFNSNFSIFQTFGFYFLGQSNYPYSFSIWVYPFLTNGTLIELRSDLTNDVWWTPMLGFDYSNHLVTQTWSGLAFYYVTASSFRLPLNQWTHVVASFSTKNGLRLYVNGTLVNQTSSSQSYAANTVPSIVTVGACSNISAWSNSPSHIVANQYSGKVDEMRIYSRELTDSDVYMLFNI